MVITYYDSGEAVAEGTFSTVKASELLSVNRRTLAHHINVPDHPISAPNLGHRVVNLLDESREL